MKRRRNVFILVLLMVLSAVCLGGTVANRPGIVVCASAAENDDWFDLSTMKTEIGPGIAIEKAVTSSQTENAGWYAGGTVHLDPHNWHPDFSGNMTPRAMRLFTSFANDDFIYVRDYGGYEQFMQAADEMNDGIRRVNGDSVWIQYLPRDVISTWGPDAWCVDLREPSTRRGAGNMRAELYGDADIDAFLVSVVIEAGVAEGMDKHEAVRRIAGWFAYNMTYDASAKELTIAEAAKNRRGVCYHMTKLFNYVCDCCCITCAYQNGMVNGQAHVWNRVTINGVTSYADMAACSYYRNPDFIWMDEATLARFGRVMLE